MFALLFEFQSEFRADVVDRAAELVGAALGDRHDLQAARRPYSAW